MLGGTFESSCGHESHSHLMLAIWIEKIFLEWHIYCNTKFVVYSPICTVKTQTI